MGRLSNIPVRKLARDMRGNVAMIFTFASIPIIALMSVSIDFLSATSARDNVQAIADSAVLMAASKGVDTDDEAELKGFAEQWFDQTVPPGVSDSVTSRVARIEDGNVVIDVNLSVDPLFGFVNPWPIEMSVSAASAIIEANTRVLDVVFCIDATGSMQNTINSVKARATSFADDLNAAAEAGGLDPFDHTRIRAVFYRDFNADRGSGWIWNGNSWVWGVVHAMTTSQFFDQPNQANALRNFISTENAAGGGDWPESTYECVNEGMSSNWFKPGDKVPGSNEKIEEVYPVIVTWTDAPALTIPHTPSITSGQYPTNMPVTEQAFRDKWDNTSVINSNKLLVLFGPCSNSSYTLMRSLNGYMCGGSIWDGNTNMIARIAEAMVERYLNRQSYLVR